MEAAGKALSARKAVVPGVTYFGSEQLLKTEIDDVRPFIADFTLPADGFEINGTTVQISEELKRYDASTKTKTYRELVIHIFPPDNSSSESSPFRLLDFFVSRKMRFVQELWIFFHSDDSDALSHVFLLNVTAQAFENLTKLYFISL